MNQHESITKLTEKLKSKTKKPEEEVLLNKTIKAVRIENVKQ